MFASIKSLIPEPRQADQPRHYVGRHRQLETVSARAIAPVPAAPPALPAPRESLRDEPVEPTPAP
jgi:hypothetical protein